MISFDFSKVQLRLRQGEGKTSVFDPVRKKWVALTPEEHVRQYLLQYLVINMQYPAALIAVEKTIAVGRLKKRYDVVVYNRAHKPWLLAECKAPEVPVNGHTLQQLLSYQGTMQCRYWLLTNGHQAFCADASDSSHIVWLGSLPTYDL